MISPDTKRLVLGANACNCTVVLPSVSPGRAAPRFVGRSDGDDGGAAAGRSTPSRTRASAHSPSYSPPPPLTAGASQEKNCFGLRFATIVALDTYLMAMVK